MALRFLDHHVIVGVRGGWIVQEDEDFPGPGRH